MQKEQHESAERKHVRNVPSEWATGRNAYVCADGRSLLIPNKAFRRPEQDANGFTSTDCEVTFVNGIVYRRDEETE